MPTEQRSEQVRVTYPDNMALSDRPPTRGGTRRGGPGDAPPVAESPMSDELLESLGAMELELLDVVPLHTLEQPSDPVRRRSPGAARVPTTQQIDFEVLVGPDERAVALIEQDGLYSWSFGEIDRSETTGTTRRRRSGDNSAMSTVRFSVPIYSSSNATRRTRLFGVERVFRPIKAFLFKLPARLVIGQVVKHLEKDIEPAIVRFNGPQISEWERIESLADLDLPDDRQPRLLLMIHGTFSSTTGAFAALGATDFGRAFLQQAIDSYDAVLGFDHRTLSVDPLENAEEILESLGDLNTDLPVVVDAVAHSRGGLVVRSLVEHLLPASDLDIRVGRAVFVACTNAGTELANSENWHRLIDLYTNIAIGSAKALSLAVPAATPTTAIVGGLLKGLAVFVKAMATTTLDEAQVLGLAAMSPDGQFIQQINRTQPGQPDPGVVDYYAIVADFEPDLAGEGALPSKLLKAMADGAVDQLMGEENDLVVNVRSMVTIDPHRNGFVSSVFDYGSTGHIYHGNYFHHEGTTKSLQRWLNLVEPSASMLGGVPDRRGGTIAPEPPTYVEDDFVLVSADLTGEALQEALEGDPPEFVVIYRQDSPASPTYHYAYRPEELLALNLSTASLGQEFQLGESITSHPRSVEDVASYESRSPVSSDHPQTGRAVVFSDDQVIGVLPNDSDMRMAIGPPPDPSHSPPPPAHAPSRHLRRRRGRNPATGSPEPPATVDKPETAHHFFRAQMPAEVEVDEVATVDVTVALEELAVVASRAGAAGAAVVAGDRPLVFDVRARKGFEVLGEARTEMEALQPGDAPIDLFFDVRATDIGPGEVDVIVRQGQVPLVMLKMEPKVVREKSQRVQSLTTVEASVPDAPRLKGPINELIIFEQTVHGETSLKFMFRSPELNIRATAESEAIPGGLETFVANVYQSIEDKWVLRKHTPEEFTKDLQAIGMTMFEQIVPPKIQKVLWNNRKVLSGIQVLSSEPYIPWEIVHLKGSGATTRDEWFLGQLGLVRWLENLEGNGFGPEHIDIAEALAVVPDYPEDTDWELTEPAVELDYLLNKLRATRLESTRAEVDRVLETPDSFDLFHFAGHGSAPPGGLDASLILGVEPDGRDWLTVQLDSMTVQHRANLTSSDKRPMVVLNACQVGRLQRRLAGTGGFAKAFLSKGAGLFVSSLWAVGDEPAREFVEGLYESLLSGSMVADAVVQARTRARDSGDVTWLAYTVYGNPHATVSFP